MQQNDEQVRSGHLINVRKLAALDIIFHGNKLILIEFLLSVFICSILGLFFLFFIGNHTFTSLLLGIGFSGIAINYVPLLFYAFHMLHRDKAAHVLEREMMDLKHYGRKYTLQSLFLILVPFALALLALYQGVVHLLLTRRQILTAKK